MREAVVLVGGQGTRLRPLTLTLPKPMLPVAGVPFVTHQLTRLAAAGVEHVVLATSYRSEMFVEHFGDGASLGLKVDFATEVEALGTGGGIRNVADLLQSGPDDPVLILNGDVLSGHDMAAQVDVHVASGAAVTLHLVEVEDPRAFGCVPTDDSGKVLEFLEKTPNPPTNRINAGCYVFKRSVIDSIAPGVEVSVERDTFPGLLTAGETLMSYVEPAYWLDVGTPNALVRGSADVVLGRVPGAAVETVGEAVIDPDAAVDGAVVDGGSSIGAKAVVGDGATVTGSIVADGAWIGAGCLVEDSAIGPRAWIGAGTKLRGVVVGADATVGEGNEIGDGGAMVKVWIEATIGDGALRF